MSNPSLDLDGLEALRPMLVARIRRSLGDDAQDIVADVLADAALRIQAGERVTVGNVKTLLSWRTTDELRRRQCRPYDIGIPEHCDPADEERTTEPSAAAFETFSRLSPRQQLLMALRAAGFSYREVAALAGLPYYTAKKHGWKARHDARPVDCPLSERQRVVLQACADGLEYQAIARRLRIGAATVATHQARTQAKLGVHTTAGAVAVGIRNRWIR